MRGGPQTTSWAQAGVPLGMAALITYRISLQRGGAAGLWGGLARPGFPARAASEGVTKCDLSPVASSFDNNLCRAPGAFPGSRSA